MQAIAPLLGFVPRNDMFWRTVDRGEGLLTPLSLALPHGGGRELTVIHLGLCHSELDSESFPFKDLANVVFAKP